MKRSIEEPQNKQVFSLQTNGVIVLGSGAVGVEWGRLASKWRQPPCRWRQSVLRADLSSSRGVEYRSEIRIEKDPKLFEVSTKSTFSPFMHHLWELVHFKNPTLYLNVVTLSGDGVLYIDVECLCDVLEALEGSTLPSWTCLSDLKSYLTRSSGRASPPQLPKCTCTVTPLGALGSLLCRRKSRGQALLRRGDSFPLRGRRRAG